MKVTTAFLAALAALPSDVLARPSMDNVVRGIGNIAMRDDSEGFDDHQLIGDLRTLSDRDLTKSGKDIKKILLGKGKPESREMYLFVPPRDSRQCKRDTCCVWKYISDEMVKSFRGRSGRCTKWARFAVRMGFHDAGTWSSTMEEAGGGADGSIVHSDELSLPENAGLGDMGDFYRAMYTKYHDTLGFTDVTMADLIQMGANVAHVVCPLGPRVRSWVGRQDVYTANPGGLLPDVFADADSLIQLFKEKTIGPHGLVALLGAHTTSQQNHVNVSRAGDPQDSTPGIWDVLFYAQTLGQVKVPERVFMFPSDVAISKHPEARKEWLEFADKGGQDHWNEDYAQEYIRLSLLGVNNINDLVECTKVLPQPITSFSFRDRTRLDKWLASNDYSGKSKEISEQVEEGDEIDVPDTKIPGKITLKEKLRQWFGKLFG